MKKETRSDIAICRNKKEQVAKSTQVGILESLTVESQEFEQKSHTRVLKNLESVPQKSIDKSKKSPKFAPVQPEIKLPVLPVRYNGSGCALEIDVLEKHKQNCR